MEFKLPNGYVVGIYAENDKVIIELTNPKGYVITDRPLSEEELKEISDKFSI